MVKQNANIQLENLPDGTQRLILKEVTTEDAGEYRCIASNQYGDVWSDVTLVVQGFFLLSYFEKFQKSVEFRILILFILEQLFAMKPLCTKFMVNTPVYILVTENFSS